MTLLTRTRTSKAMPDIAEFMTTQEAAEKLGFTIRAVNRLVATKRLDGIKVGRMYLISRESVSAYLDKTKGMSKNDPRRKTESQ
ncbi:MAG: helix-turn-helix domain-containing protein [Chloroflexota bacterium]